MTGEERLRASLRRLRPRRRGHVRWWPELSPAQTAGLISVALTLGLGLWENLKKRFGWQ